MIRLIVLFFFFSLFASGQDSTKIKSTFGISGIYAYGINSPIFNLNVGADNSIDYKKLEFSTNTAYSLQHNKVLVASEFQQKSNIERKNLFILHMFNSSMSRKIQSDNSYGFGIGKWWKYGSVSYAMIYQKTNFIIYSNEVLRHSIRLKLKYDSTKFGIFSEYYIQPNVKNFEDNIVYGVIKFSIFNHKKINYTITDNINYRSMSNVKLIHNITLGINFNLNKS